MSTPDGKGGRRRLPVLIEPEELELRTWVQMVRTFTRLERRLEQAAEARGLSLAQFDVLITLGRDQGITQRELAERLLVTKGNVCGLVDRMEGAGWVERRPDRDDRRVNRLFVTRAGRSLLTRAFPGQRDTVKAVLGALRPEELQQLHDLLDRLEEAAGD